MAPGRTALAAIGTGRVMPTRVVLHGRAAKACHSARERSLSACVAWFFPVRRLPYALRRRFPQLSHP